MTATTTEPQGHQGDGRTRRVSIARFVLGFFAGLSAWVLLTFFWDSYIDSEPFVLGATLTRGVVWMLFVMGVLVWRYNRARSREARPVTRSDSTVSRLP